MNIRDKLQMKDVSISPERTAARKKQNMFLVKLVSFIIASYACAFTLLYWLSRRG